MDRVVAFTRACLLAKVSPPETVPPTDDKQEGGDKLFDADCTSHGFTDDQVPHRGSSTTSPHCVMKIACMMVNVS